MRLCVCMYVCMNVILIFDFVIIYFMGARTDGSMTCLLSNTFL